MRRIAWLALASSTVATAAAAQDAPTSSMPSPTDIANRDTITVGLGAGVLPDYEGSDDYRIVPVAAVRGKYHGISFSTRGSYLYVDLIPSSDRIQLDAGPIVGARLNTRRHVDDAAVKLLPNLKTVFEAGGFAGISLHDVTNPYDTLAFRVDVLHGLGGDHNWTNVNPNVEFSTPLSRTTYVSLGAGLEFAGKKYADYYFTITPADSALTGGVLPAFNAGGGLKNWKLGMLVNQSITGDLLGGLSIFGAGQYSRLVGDFRRSPLVSQRGSAGQWLAAAGLAYTW